MKQKNAIIFILGGAIICALCLFALIYGVLDYIERSQYQNLTQSYMTPILFILGLIAGVYLIISGIKKTKQ